MTASEAALPDQTAGPAAPAPGSSRRRLIILLAPVLLLVASAAALWFQGTLPRLLGLAAPAKPQRAPPAFIDLPEIIANLNSDPRHPRYVKLKIRLEAQRDDIAALNAAMPRLIDLFQTYLREARPEDLQGALGTYRLRQELIARAAIVAAPAKVTDVLFAEMLIQ